VGGWVGGLIVKGARIAPISITLLLCPLACACVPALPWHPVQVGVENKLVVFMGRITHQKGCDLIGMAAEDILHGNKRAQVGVRVDLQAIACMGWGRTDFSGGQPVAEPQLSQC